MRFALLGDHPDGLEMARALARSGRHEVTHYSGPTPGAGRLRRQGLAVKAVADVEEILADPAVEAVVVAGRPGDRAAQLRRALQSERHVLCVHPADASPDAAYEAAMIRGDTGVVLLPLLPDALHPAVRRLADVLRGADRPLGELRLIELEQRSPQAVVLDAGPAGTKPTVPGWNVLRALGGEIAEVSAFAEREELAAEQPALLAGRFEPGGLFQESLLPEQREGSVRLRVVGSAAEAELLFPQGWTGPASLKHPGPGGRAVEERWEAWDPWPALVEAFDAALALPPAQRGEHPRPSWQDAVRCLELDDAARRSVERRRASALEYPEASEEAGFKGTMTLVGCGLLWGSLALLVLSRWFPRLGWLIVPVLVVFLGLQLLRWIVPRRSPGAGGQP